MSSPKIKPAEAKMKKAARIMVRVAIRILEERKNSEQGISNKPKLIITENVIR